MTKTQVQGCGRQTSWRNPVLRFEGGTSHSADAVYDLLEDLQSHLEWPAGTSSRQPGCSRWRLRPARRRLGPCSSPPAPTARWPGGRPICGH